MNQMFFDVYFCISQQSLQSISQVSDPSFLSQRGAIKQIWVFEAQTILSTQGHAILCMGAAHGLRTPGKEIAFTAQPKINSHSQIFRCGRSKFCWSRRPKFSDFFDLCLHWVSVVRGHSHLNSIVYSKIQNDLKKSLIKSK